MESINFLEVKSQYVTQERKSRTNTLVAQMLSDMAVHNVFVHFFYFRAHYVVGLNFLIVV